MALAAGATLVVLDDETVRLGPDLVPWLRHERISVFSPPPTLLRALGCADPETELPDLRLLHVGGEPLPTDVAERWAPGRRLSNDYGPTETTVTALRGWIQPGAPITIGRPVLGVKAWVLNESLEEVRAGEMGELCLGGVGLARGYMNDPELTARKFPQHPRLGRIYRTGDLVHQGEGGDFYCHGRIDAQVKVRGYRIELEAIETRLLECPGVREAACRVQGEGGQKKIAAFLVPPPDAEPPCFHQVKETLRLVLPEYMVPSLFAVLSELPRTVSGKLNRRNLPLLESNVLPLPQLAGNGEDGHKGPAHHPEEEKVLSAFQTILQLEADVSADHDFFNDLGGDSLLAAQVISKLRGDPATSALTVRDLYEVRTARELARKILPTGAANQESAPPPLPERPSPQRAPRRAFFASLIQASWLAFELLLIAPILYAAVFVLLPALTENLGLVPLLFVTPLLYFAGLSAYTAATVAFAVCMKRLLIGRYQPTRAPVWGSFYVRNWIVQHTVRLIPWGTLEGTVFQLAVLRALGARIGRRVHIHRGVNLLLGGWDLLDIGDDVTLSQDSVIGLVEFEQGQIVVGPVALGSGCTLDVRAGVASHTCLEDDAYLTPLSFLPRGGRIPAGQRWDGIPAHPAGLAPARPDLKRQGASPPVPADQRAIAPRHRRAATLPLQREWSPAWHGLFLGLARAALNLLLTLPTAVLLLTLALLTSTDFATVVEWMESPSCDLAGMLLALTLVVCHVPLTLAAQALAMRLLGPVREGVVSRWSLAYIRIWLKTGILESANGWLLGSLLWPVWLRCAGMKIGRGCEMSTLIDTIPELVEVGPGSFFADYIYLAPARVHRGAVTLARIRFGREVFLGNTVLVLAGQNVPDGVLLGINTVADDARMRPHSSWFGHPPFELPKREVLTCESSWPVWARYANRIFWDLMRFALPLAPFGIALAWFALLAAARDSVSGPVFFLGVVPALDLGVLAALIGLGMGLKWLLLGRVKPGVHPLFSSWCSRWEFHYVAWDLYTVGPLSALEGTLFLNWVLRGMGMKIGREVVFGPGLAFQIDHDMLEVEDGATVIGTFQAHTFEDRVLKIDRVKVGQDATIGSAAVLLYGSDIGARTDVAPHSVVMKHERLLPDCRYEGCPTRLAQR